MQETMKEVWPSVKRHVPLSCMAQSMEYGSPGWCLDVKKKKTGWGTPKDWLASKYLLRFRVCLVCFWGTNITSSGFGVWKPRGRKHEKIPRRDAFEEPSNFNFCSRWC